MSRSKCVVIPVGARSGLRVFQCKRGGENRKGKVIEKVERTDWLRM